MVLRLELPAEHDGGVAHALLDDPGALDHAGNELEDAVAPPIGSLVVSRHEPAECASGLFSSYRIHMVVAAAPP